MNQIKNQYVLFDWGMGREIKKRLPSFDPVLWSASGLIDNPELVESVHQSFIDAGSTVITTNNYTVVPHVLKQRDSLHLFESLVCLLLIFQHQTLLICLQTLFLQHFSIRRHYFYLQKLSLLSFYFFFKASFPAFNVSMIASTS